jgi:hypothetical protein
LPFGCTLPIRTRPESTSIMLSPASPRSKIVSPVP